MTSAPVRLPERPTERCSPEGDRPGLAQVDVRIARRFRRARRGVRPGATAHRRARWPSVDLPAGAARAGPAGGRCGAAARTVHVGGVPVQHNAAPARGLELSPLRSGLAFIPCVGAFALVSLSVPRLSGRLRRPAIPVGLSFAALSYLFLGPTAGGGVPYEVVTALIGLGLGVMPLIISVALEHVPVEDAPMPAGYCSPCCSSGRSSASPRSGRCSSPSPATPGRPGTPSGASAGRWRHSPCSPRPARPSWCAVRD